MKKYYEIARLVNAWPDMGEYEDLEKLIHRGWMRKALSYFSDWDFGEENLDTARSYGHIWDTPTDPHNPGDSVVYEKDGYYICQSHDKVGLYDAYYLVGTVEEEELI